MILLDASLAERHKMAHPGAHGLLGRVGGGYAPARAPRCPSRLVFGDGGEANRSIQKAF